MPAHVAFDVMSLACGSNQATGFRVRGECQHAVIGDLDQRRRDFVFGPSCKSRSVKDLTHGDVDRFLA